MTPPTRLSGQNLWSGAWICPPATWATGGSGPQPYGAICNFGDNPFGGGGRTGPTMEPATGFGLVWRIACRRTLPNRPPPRLLRSTRRRSSTSRCSVGPWPSSWVSTRQKITGFTASNHFLYFSRVRATTSSPHHRDLFPPFFCRALGGVVRYIPGKFAYSG